MEIEKHYLKSNGDFGIIKEPFEKKQHSNQQRGLDLYIQLVNFSTGEICTKKLYKNTKGLHFKHTGYSPMYLVDFKKFVWYVPFQIIEDE